MSSNILLTTMYSTVSIVICEMYFPSRKNRAGTIYRQLRRCCSAWHCLWLLLMGEARRSARRKRALAVHLSWANPDKSAPRSPLATRRRLLSVPLPALSLPFTVPVRYLQPCHNTMSDSLRVRRSQRVQRNRSVLSLPSFSFSLVLLGPVLGFSGKGFFLPSVDDVLIWIFIWVFGLGFVGGL